MDSELAGAIQDMRFPSITPMVWGKSSDQLRTRPASCHQPCSVVRHLKSSSTYSPPMAPLPRLWQHIWCYCVTLSMHAACFCMCCRVQVQQSQCHLRFRVQVWIEIGDRFGQCGSQTLYKIVKYGWWHPYEVLKCTRVFISHLHHQLLMQSKLNFTHDPY